jgi:hypothetical protein
MCLLEKNNVSYFKWQKASNESSSRERRAHTSKEINTDGISRSPKIALLIFEIHKLAERYLDRLLAEGEIYTAHNTVSI